MSLLDAPPLLMGSIMKEVSLLGSMRRREVERSTFSCGIPQLSHSHPVSLSRVGGLLYVRCQRSSSNFHFRVEGGNISRHHVIC